MKFSFHRILFIVITIVIFTGCKKDKKEVTYTHSYYIGDTDKRLPDSPTVRYENNSLYVTTSSEKEIEITLNTDEIIKYKGKFMVSYDGTVVSNYFSPSQEILTGLTPYPNEYFRFSYSKKEKSTNVIVSYSFFGKKQ